MKKTNSRSGRSKQQSRTEAVIIALENSSSLLKAKTITAGFDGFVDSIVRIIQKKEEGKRPVYFDTIAQLGKYIRHKQNASFSLELEQLQEKPGGNMPIMANTLGTLGAKVNCIGSFGKPEIHTVFKSLSRNCKLYSFANSGLSTAMEFHDGKMFLAQMGKLHAMGWKKIADTIGKVKLFSLFRQSEMICLLNWSEIDASSDIWKGLLRDVLKHPKQKNFPDIFVDLSDCSKRSEKKILEACNILRAINNYGRVTLSLNRNEAGILYKVFKGKAASNNLQAGGKLYKSLSIDTLLLHSPMESTAFRKNETVSIPTFHTKKPVLSTGAGDNFNAGFCIGRLLQLDLSLCVILANATAGFYVRNGRPASSNDLISFLKKN